MASDSEQAELENLLSEYEDSTETPEPTPNVKIGKLARATLNTIQRH